MRAHFLNTDDYLGLVSERDIVVADPKVTGRGDLEISAAIYARGWFRVDNIDGGGNGGTDDQRQPQRGFDLGDRAALLDPYQVRPPLRAGRGRRASQ